MVCGVLAGRRKKDDPNFSPKGLPMPGKTGSYCSPRMRTLIDKYASTRPASRPLSRCAGWGRRQPPAVGRQGKADAHKKLYDNLSNWLCRDEGGAVPGANDLMEAIVSNDRDAYLRAQAEALAWLEWMKKFATAYLKKPDKGEGGEGNNA